MNYDESVLIFNEISNTLRFVKAIENRISEKKKKKSKEEIGWDDIPFSDEEPSDEEIEAAGDRWIQPEIDRARGK